MPEEKKEKKHNYYKWSVEQGDYKRDETARWSFQKKQIIKRRIKLGLYILFYIIIVAAVAYFIFTRL
jgi:hypothetical protein